jgi:hypothetical protein
MRALISAVTFCASSFFHVVDAYSPQLPINAKTPSSLDLWLAATTPIARQTVLNNIGAGGANAGEALPGVVIASPSENNPNCKISLT